MRIVAGAWRGRSLTAPPGQATRPTADRVRQALFDMLLHAPWAGRDCVEGAVVLDVFAGTGALGLEALGLGPQNDPTLGMTIFWAIYYGALLRGMWWWWGGPVLLIVLLFTGLFLVAAGLDEIANPRLRRAV